MANISLSKMFASLLATVILSATITVVNAVPFPSQAKYATHRTRHIGRGLKLEVYNPASSYQTYGLNGTAMPEVDSLVKPAWSEQTMSFVTSNLGVKPEELAWRSGFTQGDQGFGYLRQSHNGIPFSNAVSNIAFQNGKLASYGSSFVDLSSAKIADSVPTVSWRSVLPDVENSLNAKYNDQNATLEYYVQPDGSVALTHIIQLQNKESGAWYEALIDAHSGDLISVNDFLAHASYTVLPITKETIQDGLETLTDPEDLEVSPLGWHSFGRGLDTDTTSGNNVVAFKGQTVTVQSGDNLSFNFRYNDNLQPSQRENVDAARTNAFFVMNVLHDVTYRYGFTERTFNFQESNLGLGGREGDRVQISVQDGRGTNNAQFATPPDGTSGQCRMFIWTLTNVPRDGTMENDIMIHEFAHGLTNRMTGGGTARCLQTTESGGLGEGWGDALADWFAQEDGSNIRDFVIGAYVINRPGGLRDFPYSTSAATNPLRFSSLNQLAEVHQIGQVWANMLHNVLADLVTDFGFSNNKLKDADGAEGNIVWMRLFVDALALQPCNPTFIQAKNAWLQADQNRYGGAHICTIARAFASRGLGLNARGGRQFVDDDTLPAGC